MAIQLKELPEQVIVITGASSGIGLATAVAASQQGASLVLVARSEHVLADVCEQINSTGGHAIYVVADVAGLAQVQNAAERAKQEFGRIDTWINNAGVSIYGRIREVIEEDNKRLFDTNFWGVVHGSLVALPYLGAQGGALINVGSEVSEAVIPMQGMYSASKHAVKGFTDCLRLELEAENAPISVTLIQPTAVNTPYPHHAKNYMTNEPKLPTTPMIQPERVADAILTAATSPTHVMKVGMGSKINTFMANNFPRLAGAMAKKMMDKQQRNEPARNPDGALYNASEDGEIYGDADMKEA